MNPEFLKKLKCTLDQIIKVVKAQQDQINALNHSVNDVLIGGLTDAAEEQLDNEKFSYFVDDFSDLYSPYCELAKALKHGGDDYDFAEELYAGSKDKEDVKAYIEEQINDLKAQKDAIDRINLGGDNTAVIEVAESEDSEGKSVNDYLAEIDKALKGE